MSKAFSQLPGFNGKLGRNYRACCMAAVVGIVYRWELVAMPDVHTMFTVRHFIVAPRKQPAQIMRSTTITIRSGLSVILNVDISDTHWLQALLPDGNDGLGIRGAEMYFHKQLLYRPTYVSHIQWNNLPAELRQADISFQRFQWLLKTFCSGAEVAAHCD